MCLNINRIILSLLIYVFISPVYAEQKLIFAIDIVRHGDRTPTVIIPKDRYNWPNGPGELTPLGMQQEYMLGGNLRKLYVYKYKLLPKHYDSQVMYVYSSDFDRTLMSAQSLLLGLYPLTTGPRIKDKNPALPQLFQPIPIHTTSNIESKLLVPEANQPEYDEMIKKYTITTGAWQNLSTQNQINFQKWSAKTGLTINSLNQLIPLSDNLYIRYKNDIPVPTGISNQDRDQIIKLGQWAQISIFKTPEVSYYSSINLRQVIINYLYNATISSSKLKYVLFLAHDSTIMAFMNSIDNQLDAIPPYASDLKILLFSVGNKKYGIKLEYNGKHILLPWCKNTDCSLDQFITILDKPLKH